DPDGPELGQNGVNSAGDQLLIYQLPVPTNSDQSSFVTMIQMDNDPNGAVDTDEESELPSSLPANCIVRFNNEYDNAKYDCSPTTDNATNLRNAISNDNGSGGLKADGSNNWIENNANNIDLSTSCGFCCGNVPPINAPSITAPFEVMTNTVFTIHISGTLGSGASWQLFTAGCGVGNPIQTTMADSFNVTSIGTENDTYYYVRSSQTTDCGALCDVVKVHTCSTPYNQTLCTDCNADPSVCGTCNLPYPYPNPTPAIGCYAIRIIFVLDESGSINGFQNNVRDGVLAFLNALNGQDAQVALIEFSDQERLVNDYVTVDQTYIDDITGYFNGIPYNGQTYNPGGSTNWHDAMKEADALTNPDFVLFFTDGSPTCWTQANGTVNYCGNGGTTQTPEIVNPVKLANKIKSEGTHMFMLGVGSGIDTFNL
ncbi:MAG TPA: vWA domain-containing protein, partial [Saprospiraceae bacterium]|nr:vWA domain-containing protein [Saprospiraceae bacterium]